jgi:general secretion pathway protein A
MTLNFNLDPLTPEEVDAYIRHRLKVAGTQERIFDWDAVQEIFLYSGGFPRRINILCDHALLSGFVKEQRLIDAKIVNECAKELKIPAHVDNRDLNAMFEPRAYPSNKNNAPKESSSKTFAPNSPAQHPNSPSLPVQQPENKFFSWDKLVILICFFLFAWYFMFPDHFVSTLSQVKQSFNRSQGIPTEQNTGQTIQPGNRVGVQNPKPPEADNPSSGEVNAEKKASGRAENPGELVFAIKPPETDIASGQKNLPPPLPEERITVRFKYNGDAIIEKDLKKLEALSKSLVAHQNSKILITGYTDAMENGTYNVKLSEFRANIVKSFLLGMGVKNYQMRIQGRGAQDPIESNDTVWGRMMNRRVEIEIIN